MGCHLAGVFDRAAVADVLGDRGGPEGVAAGCDRHAGIAGATLDHRPCVLAEHAVFGQVPLAVERAEEGTASLAEDPGGDQVLVEVLRELVVGRHLVVLTALLVEPQPQRASVFVQIADVHLQRRANPGESVDHDGDQRPVPEAADRGHVDRVEQPPGIGAVATLASTQVVAMSRVA